MKYVVTSSIMCAIAPPDEGSYSHAGIGYANPDAVTQIANGFSTTTYSYDQNGNLTQKTTYGVTTTYLWDYANRLIALGSGGATTTYGYDAFGSRVFQSTATTTTLYPFKWYSVASSTVSGATYATTTEYVFNGDTLVSTVDQQFASGVATGTPVAHYIYPDHLGSTNVVTDASGTVVQALDYYPYGSTRISSGQNAESRQYIGQYSDTTGLDYLNARYYDGSRGQFLTEDLANLCMHSLNKFVLNPSTIVVATTSDPGFTKKKNLVSFDFYSKIIPNYSARWVCFTRKGVNYVADAYPLNAPQLNIFRVILDSLTVDK